ncbi:MAG: sigma-70 family RNA polymerase sigma factor [Actinomycetota bacterium]|nr:sigma-70 family RNA polymerase sigma factor [Actinomycetota bacterium]
MSVSEDPLDELVTGVRAGNPDAIAEVYLQVAPALRSFLRAEVRHGEVADDLVEHTFVELLEAHATIRGGGRALRSWLFRAARNNLFDWRRRAARRADHELRQELTATLEDPDPTPETVAGERDALAEIRDALGELSPDQREVLELRLIAELTSAEVAELTSRTVGAVKALQHRGLAKLAGVLQARLGGRGS